LLFTETERAFSTNAGIKATCIVIS
jgi:hypothetical protein